MRGAEALACPRAVTGWSAVCRHAHDAAGPQDEPQPACQGEALPAAAGRAPDLQRLLPGPLRVHQPGGGPAGEAPSTAKPTFWSPLSASSAASRRLSKHQSGLAACSCRPTRRSTTWTSGSTTGATCRPPAASQKRFCSHRGGCPLSLHPQSVLQRVRSPLH